MLAVGASVVRLAVNGPRDAAFTAPEDSLPAIRSLQGQPGSLKMRPWGTRTLLPAKVREVAAAGDVRDMVSRKARKRDARLMLAAWFCLKREAPPPQG